MRWRQDQISRLKDEWNRLVKSQYKAVRRADFYPIPEDLLGRSDTLYNERSNLTSFVRVWQDMVVPIRILFHAGATITAYDVISPANPSVALDDACKFRLEAMDAALRETPLDLLVMQNSFVLPSPQEWSRDAQWAAREFPDVSDGSHALYGYARSLFLKRIDTAASDFLAFREAAIALNEIGLFEPEADNASGTCVNALVQELFPTIKARATALAQRHQFLTRCAENEAAAPVGPETSTREAPHTS